MNWVVEFHQDFEPEFDALPEEVQNKLLARVSFWKLSAPNWDDLMLIRLMVRDIAT